LTADPALLGRQQVDLWYVCCDELVDPRLWDEYRGLLAAEEAQRAARFVKEKDRRQFLAGWAMVRMALSHYTSEDPRNWVFARNAHGKPSVSQPADMPLHFNLSHTSGLAVCAVGWCELGVDAEEVNRAVEYRQLAQHFFAPAEIARLEELAPEEQRTRFFRLWTLKESLLKAFGAGLSIPLREVAFSLAADRPPQVSLGESLTARPNRWQFAEICLAPRWRAALAVPLPAGETQKLVLTIRETLPLRWQREPRVLPPNASNFWSV
jgi:4'-phosphopantetheinyl transferase